MKQSLSEERIQYIEKLIEQLYHEMATLSPPQQAQALQRLRIKLDVL